MYVSNYINPKSQRSLLIGEKSIGTVVKTPEELEHDNLIGVFIPRLMFGLTIAEGAYEKDISFKASKIKNSKNKTIGSTKFKSRNYVELPIAQTGNVISPKFVKGENVFIECCDRDIKNMYVLPYTMQEQSRRKYDVYNVMCPNFKEYDEASVLDLDNTYGMSINTKDKVIAIWTSCEGGGETGDNEKGIYLISIDSKNGEILISDNGKRTLTMNTDEDRWTMLNEAGSKIEMVEDTINIYAPSTINIEADDEINVKSSKLNREHDDIKSSASTDTEEIDTLDIKGNKLTSDYSTTSIKSSSYENNTQKWATTSPISGFSAVLTSASYSVSPNAGSQPTPTAPQFTSGGQMQAGNPSTPSLPVTLFMPTSIVLNAIAAKLDAVCSIVGCPPTSVSAVSSWMSSAPSKSVFG